MLRAALMILSGIFVNASSGTGSAIGIALLVIHILIFALFAYVSIRRLVLQCCTAKKPSSATPTSTSHNRQQSNNGFSNGHGVAAMSADIELNMTTTSTHNHMLSSQSQSPSDDV
jgi:hypothetical protein